MKKTTTAPIANDLSAQKIKAPTTGHKTYKTTQKYLFVRVNASGHRVWECHYRIDGHRQKMTLGAVTTLSFNRARAKTLEVVEAASSGQCPKEKAQRAAMADITVSDVLKEFDKRHLSKLGRPETPRGRIKRWIEPAFAEKRITAVRKQDFIKLMNRIEDKDVKQEHTRIIKLCRQIWDFAVERGFVESNPVPAMKTTSKARTRFLSGSEIGKLWRDADSPEDGRKCPFDRSHTIAWKLILLTGQRISTLLQAEKGHFDLDQALWTIPASLMKTQDDDTGQAHTVHLSPLAVDLVREAMSLSKCRYLFTGIRSTSKPLSAQWFSKKHKEWLAGMKIPPATVHDYRRALATHCADLGIAPYVTEKILAHEMGGVMAVYNRGQYLEDRKTALVAYSQWVTGLVAGGNIVPMRSKKQKC